jgi:hypothetical protein
MKAIFVELPAFSQHRESYLDDHAYAELQAALMQEPDAGAVIREAGGLRKPRLPDKRRGKGKRGGLRVIYYWWPAGSPFWLYTIYDKDEADDLSAAQRRALRTMIQAELAARRQP